MSAVDGRTCLSSSRCPAPSTARLRRLPHGRAQRTVIAAVDERTPQQQDPASLDISSAVVTNVSYRSTPWTAEAAQAAEQRTTARVLFVSESGICRSVLAAAAFSAALARHPSLASEVECGVRATQSYCVGEPPHPAAVQAAEALGLPLPPGCTAVQFDDAGDIAAAELVLTMDKYTAADVLREVSVFDTIAGSGYSQRVRRLGELHPELGAAADPEAQDIADPLYGNLGGAEEAEAVAAAARVICECCEGLVALLLRLQEQEAGPGGQGRSLRQTLAAEVAGMASPEWLVPPMLQPKAW